MIKLKQTEEKLGFPVPGYLFDFIAGLKQPEVQFQEETWLFWTVTDKPEDPMTISSVHILPTLKMSGV